MKPSLVQGFVIAIVLAFVFFMVREKLAAADVAGTLAATLVGSVWLAMSQGNGPKDPPPPANLVSA